MLDLASGAISRIGTGSIRYRWDLCLIGTILDRTVIVRSDPRSRSTAESGGFGTPYVGSCHRFRETGSVPRVGKIPKKHLGRVESVHQKLI